MCLGPTLGCSPEASCFVLSVATWSWSACILREVRSQDSGCRMQGVAVSFLLVRRGSMWRHATAQLGQLRTERLVDYGA